MKIVLLPSSVSRDADGHTQYLTSYLVNDSVAVDAGSLGFCGSPQDQSRVRHILISHTHIDHIASLPILLDTVYEDNGECVTVYGSEPVLDCLRRDVFNDRVWPDFIGLSAKQAPFLKLVTLQARQTIELAGLRITPVPVDHIVPTLGFVLEDEAATVVIASDTGPTDEIWQHANRARNLKAAFLEASYPNDMNWLAIIAKHLTPAMFGQEAAKIKAEIPIIAVHVKARFRDQIVRELKALGMTNIEVGEPGKVYSF